MGDQNWLDEPLDRHRFLEFVGKGAAVVVIGGALYLLARKDDFVCSPRAMPEKEFLSLCLRCDKCQKARPWGLISSVPLTESIISAGAPVLYGYYRYCLQCVTSCPTGALR